MSENRLKLLEIFVLAQALDLLTTLIAILYMDGVELNLIMNTVEYLIFAKTIAVLTLTQTLINIKPKLKYLKLANIISSIPVFLNTFQIILEVI